MKSTTDIWFCAFLRLRGIDIAKHEKIEHGKVRCFFKLEEEKWAELKKEFFNSEFSKFKCFVELIKDLAY